MKACHSKRTRGEAQDNKNKSDFSLEDHMSNTKCRGAGDPYVYQERSIPEQKVGIKRQSEVQEQAREESEEQSYGPPEAGVTPTLTSGSPKVASSDAITRSQFRSISTPPPYAPPRTAAMSGLHDVVRREIDPKPWVEPTIPSGPCRFVGEPEPDVSFSQLQAHVHVCSIIRDIQVARPHMYSKPVRCERFREAPKERSRSSHGHHVDNGRKTTATRSTRVAFHCKDRNSRWRERPVGSEIDRAKSVAGTVRRYSRAVPPRRSCGKHW